MIATLATLTLALAPILAQPADGARPVLQALPNPAGERSGLPNLAVGADGRVYLSWVEPGAEGSTRLRFSILGAEGWSPAKTIAEGTDWFVNWADFPSLAVLPDGTLAAHWLARVGTEAYSYGVQVSLSRDDGATWSAPIVPHSDRSPTEHGFVSMAAIDADRFAIVWLDGRARARAEGIEHAAHGEGETALFTVTIDRDGKLGAERIIDHRTCECCPTAAALVGGRLLVAYRDRGDDETRDCSFAYVTADSITAPATIHADGWKQEGCPVNGPALASRESAVAAVWYTEANGRPQVLLARSEDGGRTFGKPVAIDDGNAVGRVDVVTHPDLGWLAVWLERGDGGGEVRGRSIGAQGELRPSVLIARTSLDRASGFPRIERSGRRVLLAWTEVLEQSAEAGGAVPPPRVRTADLVFPPPEASTE